MQTIIKIFLLPLLFSVTLYAQESSLQENHLALATLMIYDANYEKAHQELLLVDKNSPTFDAYKYYKTLGVLFSKEKKTKEAITNYHKAIEAAQKRDFSHKKEFQKQHYLFEIATSKEITTPQIDPHAQKRKIQAIEELYLSLTQEYYTLKDYKHSLTSLQGAGSLAKRRPLLYSLKAECYYKLKQYDKAIETLTDALKRFQTNEKLHKQKFYYFAHLELYQAAIASAKEYMQKVGASAQEYLVLAQMLLSAKENASAITLLEEAKLKFPQDTKIALLLGHTYLKEGMLHASAHIFDTLVVLDKSYLKDAVEINKRARNIQRALYLNAQNIDKKTKLRQKIAIYLLLEEYRKIIALIKAVDRYKMLDDENLRYTFAYAYYMVKDYKNAQNHLKYIQDDELFHKASVIYNNIEKCTKNSLECI